ncbi:MAG: type II secretion system secretin GspD [Desulfobulbaceae bacterium]|nr:type II secretion system secretin GspD [Desulfobulbaceae bacterium]
MNLHGFMFDGKIKYLQTACFTHTAVSRKFSGTVLLVAFILLLSGGCVRHAELGPIAINPEEISAGIVKEEDKSAVLEAEVALSQVAERPKSYKVPAFEDGKNKALSQLPAKITRKGLGPDDQEGEDGIQLNFDNADIYEVIQVIAETLELNYIIDPQVKGVVNIQSGKKVPLNQLFPVFKKILHINGLDIRSEGFYDYIYVAKKSSADAIRSPDQIGQLKDSSARVIQIVPVSHISAQEALKLIEPYLSDQGSILDLPVHNMLIINDYESKVVDALRMLARLDVAALASLKVRLVRVDNAPLFDLRDELIEILDALKVNTKNFDGVSVMALERINSLLLVSNNEAMINSAWKWIEDLDTVPTLDRDNIYIYNVRNSIASELADLISALIAEDDPKSKTTQKKAVDKKDTKKAQPVPKKKTSDGTKKALSTLRFAGDPVLFADDDRNIILIRALPPDYSRVVKLLERLDNLPRQVLIEVIVAEISLTDELSLGVEWALHNNDLKINDSQYLQEFSTFGGQLIPVDNISAFTYSVFSGAGDARALLQTLASETEISILSSPQILVLNNETAMINVGDQVPIVTSETQTGTGDTSVSVDKTVQYKDTGVILEVTPQINYNGIILLDIKQTVSKALDLPEKGVQSQPIRTRELKTKLAVKDGQSIMIGGMISKDETYSETGIPLLKDIPLLGYLFKFESRSVDKTELLVMVTPYVIETEDVLDQFIKQFGQKMAELRESLHTSKQPLSSISR